MYLPAGFMRVSERGSYTYKNKHKKTIYGLLVDIKTKMRMITMIMIIIELRMTIALMFNVILSFPSSFKYIDKSSDNNNNNSNDDAHNS